MLKNLFARPQTTNSMDLTPRDFEEQYGDDESHFLLDVRTVPEFTDARAPGSVNIPLNELPTRMAELPTDQPIVVICRSGNRSMYAAQMLLQAGFSDVHNLKGGLFAWARHGNPVER